MKYIRQTCEDTKPLALVKRKLDPDTRQQSTKNGKIVYYEQGREAD